MPTKPPPPVPTLKLPAPADITLTPANVRGLRAGIKLVLENRFPTSGAMATLLKVDKSTAAYRISSLRPYGVWPWAGMWGKTQEPVVTSTDRAWAWQLSTWLDGYERHAAETEAIAEQARREAVSVAQAEAEAERRAIDTQRFAANLAAVRSTRPVPDWTDTPGCSPPRGFDPRRPLRLPGPERMALVLCPGGYATGGDLD